MIEIKRVVVTIFVKPSVKDNWKNEKKVVLKIVGHQAPCVVFNV